MPSVTYSGNFGGVGGYGGITTTLTASYGVPSGAVITGISYSLKITASAYSSSKDWIMQELSVGGGGGTPTAYESTGMTSREHVFGGKMSFSASDVSKFAGTSIQAYADAYTTHDTNSFLWDVSITVDYAIPEENVAPSTVTINGSAGTVETSASTAVLAWSGAKAGANNKISGYYVSVFDSTDNGASWKLMDEDYTVTTSATSGSVTVNLPAVGTRRKFKVSTLSVYGTPYASFDATESPVVIRKPSTTACGAPTACAVNDTLSTGNVTLSWSGASAGTGNAITGYEVQRAESTNGSTWGSWSTLTTTTATSLSVAPPSTAGNYYKYRVRTMGAAGSSYYSGWKESTNTLRRDHAPLAGFTDATLAAGTTPIKALHMQELQARVATLRAFYGLSAYSFTKIIAGQTSLAGWTAHVLEIRAALDEVANKAGKTHAAWLTITENKPRADVMQQLRNVVLSL